MPMMDKQAVFTSKLLELCSTPSASRSVDDIRFIRDRLHERFPFFKAWPPLMQQLLCQLAVSQRWVQNQVLLSAGQAPSTLFFLVTGQVAICVRSPPDSSQLVDVTRLGPGDTCGEAALLGAAASRTFLVVSTWEASGLAVDAAALATRLAALLAATPPTSTTTSSSTSGAPASAAAGAACDGGVQRGFSTGGGVCSSSGSKSRGGPYTPAAGGGASGYTSKAGSPPAGFPSTSGNYQAPGSRSSWCSHHPSSPGGLRDAYASPCSSTEPALPDQPQQRPGGISRKWGDLRTLTDASETKSVAELYSMIGCKPPVHPPLGGPADKGAPSSSSSSSRRRGGVGGQLAADVVTTAAPTTKQQQQQQGVVLDRRAQLAAVAALEQQAASSWQQATGTRSQATRSASPATAASAAAWQEASARDADDGSAALQLHLQQHQHIQWASAASATAAAAADADIATGPGQQDAPGAEPIAAGAAAGGVQAGRRAAAAAAVEWVRPSRDLPHIRPARLHGVRMQYSQD